MGRCAPPLKSHAPPLGKVSIRANKKKYLVSVTLSQIFRGGRAGFFFNFYSFLNFLIVFFGGPPFCFKNLVYPSLRAPIDQYIARRSEHEKNFKY